MLCVAASIFTLCPIIQRGSTVLSVEKRKGRVIIVFATFYYEFYPVGGDRPVDTRVNR